MKRPQVRWWVRCGRLQGPRWHRFAGIHQREHYARFGCTVVLRFGRLGSPREWVLISSGPHFGLSRWTDE